jgi:hypothetical protein
MSHIGKLFALGYHRVVRFRLMHPAYGEADNVILGGDALDKESPDLRVVCLLSRCLKGLSLAFGSLGVMQNKSAIWSIPSIEVLVSSSSQLYNVVWGLEH